MISNCMVILKPYEEPCPEPVLSCEIVEQSKGEPNGMVQDLLSQSVSQFKHS
ncbi:MAG: hypothetical protein UX25_C0017G0011 [Candidatus Woesebacteria bacterium GW2011_GWC2_45_9]|uniref:Uncharacterized protein n=1 Tax=Candidatus Woesebacteria bacterium GW2011_GWC2_45_9 TaxID=1618589 RepID=A0A0G1N921_9BACT|nr:MAG: hypothetical protein UX25_C0017G0011 [Candidatus Woesebacteria bacterium GW2011_GWC2_45_9]